MKNYIKKIFVFLIGIIFLITCFYGYYAYIFHQNLKTTKFNQIISEAKIGSELPQNFFKTFEKLNPKSTDYGFWGSLIHQKECQSLNIARRIYPYVKNQNNNRLENLSFEYFLTLKIEKNLSQIQCLNHIAKSSDFIYGNFGIERASEFYFKTNIKNMGSEQMETLIKMIKNPVLYNPLREKELQIQH